MNIHLHAPDKCCPCRRTDPASRGSFVDENRRLWTGLFERRDRKAGSDMSWSECRRARSLAGCDRCCRFYSAAAIAAGAISSSTPPASAVLVRFAFVISDSGTRRWPIRHQIQPKPAVFASSKSGAERPRSRRSPTPGGILLNDRENQKLAPGGRYAGSAPTDGRSIEGKRVDAGWITATTETQSSVNCRQRPVPVQARLPASPKRNSGPGVQPVASADGIRAGERRRQHDRKP